jgi:endonuclease/exonuclease/phosphatase family metal-dependent hydrolase
MGDFNATPEDDVIKILTSSRDSGNQIVNLSQSLPDGSGTYRYMGRWEMIDQIFVSRGLIDSSRGLNTGSNMLKICDYDFMLKDDSRYPGKSPFSTWSGFRYQGGFSDHLPVLLDLNIR